MHPGKASPPHSPFRPQFKKSPKEQKLANPDWDKITSRWQNSQNQVTKQHVQGTNDEFK